MIAWYGHPGGWAGWGGCGPGGWIWIAWMILFWGGLLAAAIYLIRHRHPAPAAPGPAAPRPGGTGPAEAVLAERYARGEIDTEEYHRRQATLREHRDQGPGT